MDTYLSLKERIMHNIIHNTNYLTVCTIAHRDSGKRRCMEMNYLREIAAPKEKTYL